MKEMNWEPWAFCTVFLLVWLGMFWDPTGWRLLAERFGTSTKVEGAQYGFVTGSVFRPGWSWMSYGYCLTVNVNRQGFGLSTWFIFGLNSPPLFMPWSEVDTVTLLGALWGKRALITFRGTESKVVLYGRAGRAVVHANHRFAATEAPHTQG